MDEIYTYVSASSTIMFISFFDELFTTLMTIIDVILGHKNRKSVTETVSSVTRCPHFWFVRVLITNKQEKEKDLVTAID